VLISEIIDRGRGAQYRFAEMVRIYTREFFQKMTSSNKPLGPIMVSRSGNTSRRGNDLSPNALGCR